MVSTDSINIALSNGYVKKGYGYTKVTKENTHWITFFDNSLQMYAYFSEDEDNFLDDIVYKKEELLILNNQKRVQARDKGLEITVDGITYLANKETVQGFAVLRGLNGNEPIYWKDKDTESVWPLWCFMYLYF